MATVGLHVREATSDDVPAVVAVFGRARSEAMPWLPVLHTHDEDLTHFGHALTGDGHRAWVATIDDAVVAFSAVGHGDLDHLYVDPDAQGRGVGAALFETVRAAFPDGFSFWVFTANVRAQAFYERLGARPLYATDGADNEERLPDLRYRWTPQGQ